MPPFRLRVRGRWEAWNVQEGTQCLACPSLLTLGAVWWRLVPLRCLETALLGGAAACARKRAADNMKARSAIEHSPCRVQRIVNDILTYENARPARLAIAHYPCEFQRVVQHPAHEWWGSEVCCRTLPMQMLMCCPTPLWIGARAPRFAIVDHP